MQKIDLKEARKTLGLNQTQMAKAMGVHRNTWIKWEREEGGRQITAAPNRLLGTLLWLKSKNLLTSYLQYFT